MLNPTTLDIPERIETKRLILQAPQAGFGEDLYAAILDGYDDYIRWLAWPKQAPSIEEVEADCRKHQAEFIARIFIRYLIIEKSTGEIIGRTAFPPQQLDWQIPQFGISYFIRRTKRGNGFAVEAVEAMTRLALQTLKAKKVEIFCDEENIASCRVPEKLNYHLEKTEKGDWIRQDGQLANLRTYVIFSESK